MNGYQGFKRVLSGVLNFMWQTKVIHPENMPTEGGYLLCCNHTSMADVIPLAVSTSQPITYMAKAEALKVPVVGKFLIALGAFPVKRGAADLGALKHAMEIIRQGGVVGFFPQGTRQPGIPLRQTVVKSGAGMIIHHTHCSVLPVCLKTKRNRVRLFHRTEVVYGKLIPYEELPFEKGNAAEYQAVSEYIFDRICALDEETE